MKYWQPASTAPMNKPVLVAFHGHGEVRVVVATRIKQNGYWGDWDYINSHDGEPQFWAPLFEPPKDHQWEGQHCGCDGCTEKYAEPE